MASPTVMARRRLVTRMTGGDPLFAGLLGLWRVQKYSGSGSLLDESGAGRDAQLGSTSGSDSNDPTFLAYAGNPYVYPSGVASNNLSVARPAATTEYVVTYDDLTTVTKTSVADPLIFGNTDADFSTKKVRSISLHNGVGGSVVGLFLASGVAAPATSYVDIYGLTWTINRSSSGKKLSWVDRTLLLTGTDDYLEVASAAFADMALTDSFSVTVRFRAASIPATSQVLIAHTDSITTGPGWSLVWTSAGSLQGQMNDGTTNYNTNAVTSIGLGAWHTVTYVRNAVTRKHYLIVDGVTGTLGTESLAGGITYAGALRFCRLAGAGTRYFDGETAGFALHRRVLSAAESVAQGQVF